jgi:predicted PurR-regulated permease PerM
MLHCIKTCHTAKKTVMQSSFSGYPFFVRASLQLLFLALIGLLLFIGQDILAPLAFALLLSVLLLPVNQYLEKKGMNRVFAILLTLFTAIVLIACFIYFLTIQIANFTEDIPAIKQHLLDHFTTLQKWVRKRFNMPIREQSKLIDNATNQMKSSGTGMIGQTFVSITQTLSVIILLPIYSFLVLYYRDLLKQFVIAVFKKDTEEKVRDILKESKSIVRSYLIGLLIEMSIVAAINALGFMILGIKYAIFLGVLAAILNLIPYIGMLIASIFCMLVTLTTSPQISDVLWVGVVLAVVQFIDNNIIMPRVVSSKVKINALISIIGVLVGGALMGLSGMFLSLPVIAILKIIFDRVEELKPWGMLFGDEITGQKKRTRRKKKKLVVEEPITP